jgi:hypothetical protein
MVIELLADIDPKRIECRDYLMSLIYIYYNIEMIALDRLLNLNRFQILLLNTRIIPTQKLRIIKYIIQLRMIN